MDPILSKVNKAVIPKISSEIERTREVRSTTIAKLLSAVDACLSLETKLEKADTEEDVETQKKAKVGNGEKNSTESNNDISYEAEVYDVVKKTLQGALQLETIDNHDSTATKPASHRIRSSSSSSSKSRNPKKRQRQQAKTPQPALTRNKSASSATSETLKTFTPPLVRSESLSLPSNTTIKDKTQVQTGSANGNGHSTIVRAQHKRLHQQIGKLGKYVDLFFANHLKSSVADSQTSFFPATEISNFLLTPQQITNSMTDGNPNLHVYDPSLLPHLVNVFGAIHTYLLHLHSQESSSNILGPDIAAVFMSEVNKSYFDPEIFKSFDPAHAKQYRQQPIDSSSRECDPALFSLSFKNLYQLEKSLVQDGDHIPALKWTTSLSPRITPPRRSLIKGTISVRDKSFSVQFLQLNFCLHCLAFWSLLTRSEKGRMQEEKKKQEGEQFERDEVTLRYENAQKYIRPFVAFDYVPFVSLDNENQQCGDLANQPAGKSLSIANVALQLLGLSFLSKGMVLPTPPLEANSCTIHESYKWLVQWLHSPETYRSIAAKLHIVYCHLMQVPQINPITEVLATGVNALPQLNKLLQKRQLIKKREEILRKEREKKMEESNTSSANTSGTTSTEKKPSDKTTLQEKDTDQVTQEGTLFSSSVGSDLPVQLALDPSQRYHSVFTCPVSRELSSQKNPPILLKCGHVICQSTFKRLLVQRPQRIKCPTCPVRTEFSGGLQLVL